MKKSCLIVVIATLAAIAGALAAVAVYLRRREKELDEYERLLLGKPRQTAQRPRPPHLPRTPQNKTNTLKGAPGRQFLTRRVRPFCTTQRAVSNQTSQAALWRVQLP
mgnify:CR=1 FL=1